VPRARRDETIPFRIVPERKAWVAHMPREGYLEMGGCAHHLTLDLLSMWAIEQEDRMAWERRNSASIHTGVGGRLGTQTILLPGRGPGRAALCCGGASLVPLVLRVDAGAVDARREV
jgi:hypothetical protein